MDIQKSPKKPFNKNNRTKIPFTELVELISKDCDYHFAIIDNDVDEELLKIPFIIRERDSIELSNHLTKKHGLTTILYRKTIGNQYVYVEEIRNGRNKSLAFVSLYKRPIKKASP